ncbi:hypothetical protein MANES_10G086600v8 [Manihot esculenta]|uniref:Uncharacterized protein n=1 Tax=Manihot esculenta TaxID=3983 RepID=A0ACB7GZQ2_MANES|nr:hypothetical protein MANES_10G086600v8 [Manihot esculenta]
MSFFGLWRLGPFKGILPMVNQPTPPTFPYKRLKQPQRKGKSTVSCKRKPENKKQMGKENQYWLLKTEPGEWSWEDQASNGGMTNWDGVKNKQAQKHLKAMKLNDLCFFYHSGASARRVVGVVSVVKEWYQSGEHEVVVDVQAIGEMRRPVDLKEMKDNDKLKGLTLFRQPRLSVVPISKEVWDIVCELGGGYEGDGNAADGDDDEEEDDNGGED